METELLPREKLLQYGAKQLTDEELLQVMLGSGVQGMPVREVAKQVLTLLKAQGYQNLTSNHIQKLRGISFAKSCMLLAALEFCARYFTPSSLQLDTTDKVLPFIEEYLGTRQEHLALLNLDGGLRFISKKLISIGTVNITVAHPREVFAAAIEARAANIILVHNHPSGVPTPSEEDREATNNILAASHYLGIRLYDHIIVTDRRDCYSFREHGDLNV